MSVVVVVLAVAVFAQGTSEFMVSGLVGEVAAEFGVTTAAAGLLTSLYAAGMVLGAPAMVALTGRLPARSALTGFLAVFAAAHVTAALTGDFAVLLGTRVVAAVANAGFLAVALAALPALAGPERVTRAVAVVVSGVTVACIAGVPAGTVLGQLWGSRAAFWAVAGLATASLPGVWALTGRAGSGVPGRPVCAEWRVLGRRPVRTAAGLAVLVNAGTFASFTYLGALAAERGGAGSGWVPVALAAFGVGSLAGVSAAGRFGDRHGGLLVFAGTPLLAVMWALAALSAGSVVAVTVWAAVLGAAAFGVGSALIAAIVAVASPDAPRVAGALATTALNIGAVLGPITAGIAIGGGSVVAALWAGAACTALAAALAALRRADLPARR